VVLRPWESETKNVKRLKADVSSVSPSPERTKSLWVELGLYGQRLIYAIGRNMAACKTGINLLNEKRSLIPWGLGVPI